MSLTDPIDEIEGLMAQCETVEFPLKHTFIDGFYIREIFMPAGSMLTSKIHKTEHPYYVSKGKINVIIDGEVKHIEAPYWGITKAGTRRLLYAVEDCTWTTFHATDKTTPEEVEEEIIEPHDNPFLSEEIKLKYNLNQKLCHLQQ